MWNRVFCFWLTAIIFLFVGCTPHTAENLGQKPLAWGKSNEVTLYCSESLQDSLLAEASSVLEQKFPTVLENEESLFSLKVGEMSRINLFYRFNHLLFVSSLGLADSTSRYIESILPEDYKAQIRSEGTKMFSMKDFWAKGQLAVFVVAPNPSALLEYFSKNKEKTFPLFYEHLIQKEKKYIFQSGTLKKAPAVLQQHIGIELPMPKIFKPFLPDSIPNFVAYRYFNARETDSPIMFLLFSRQPLPQNLDKEWLASFRQKKIGAFYRGDTFPLADSHFEETVVNDYPAYRLRSYWQNYEEFIGGIFETYAIPYKNKVVIIDLMIYYPQGNKLLHMMRLRSILDNLQLPAFSQAINEKTIYGGDYEIS